MDIETVLKRVNIVKISMKFSQEMSKARAVKPQECTVLGLPSLVKLESLQESQRNFTLPILMKNVIVIGILVIIYRCRASVLPSN